MRRLIIISLLLFSATLFAQDIAYIKANYKKAEYRIPMRDGKKLFTIVYSPKDDSKKHPFLMHSYHKF